MRWLIPTGGDMPEQFAGVLATPAHRGIPRAIQLGSRWAADNNAFSGGFDAGRFFPWLGGMEPYKDKCLFVACPDAVGDFVETRRLWGEWYPLLGGWPVAYVGQDGETEIPDGAAALFVGGTTEWKESGAALSLIQLARSRGLHVHIGRVNHGRRYRHFVLAPGSEDFTCDGTLTRFIGREKAFTAWTAHQSQRPLFVVS